MLGVRLAEGVPLDAVADRRAVSSLVDDGLVTADDGLLVLTLRGRLLADHVVRELI
jgi:oxygen-independent coproporphyrinogen-3 oxidase